MSGLWQATCVAIRGRGVLIEGPPGCGKSSLALALIDRGAELVGDDGVTLSVREGRLIAGPPSATRGLIEVRNVGLVAFPCCDEVAVALLLTLDPAAPRYVEAAEQAERGGVMLPLIRLWPGSPVLALRAELALARHGLS
jgi:hypothetical protein